MKLNNTYFLLRHGEALSNARKVYSSWPEKFKNPLTKNGKAMVAKTAKTLKENHAKHSKGIDLIFASDLLRTTQTAEIVARALNVKVKFDKRLREVDFKDLNNTSQSNFFYSDLTKKKDRESYQSILKRAFTFFKEVNGRYKGKHILIVSHQCPLWLLENKIKGISFKKAMEQAHTEQRISKAELREIT
ncbi:MAG: hypothetical protein A3A98_03605 [Candidatus Staskawiczbacteria bacterium RIFCSPLOWO2_01_FULL_40_39]|uniref:Phosphoglycerate mutase n=1 Tax=Candidatus Staskawiczbacteria bacterium RIFCSPHIGHO2_01_FULL_39_25 TaxID=1802202 RepID=A0A1G2HNQ8_9BACT|nr:MAG: hypothetical protein A2730_02880 [Candidatus Staskawiczbacteria bacterium RIFCSPHIGHO2_01_FULL_39_25]OGZ73805.1 MAG: hypothetical protein A3A98_03605 [Candidatus Staskawiczbacteria bacterium RIFCSPLOWO2_01_FULL_40_39]OGZ76640.1 MAG: hypothetical protein A3I87_02895 [Candidatus Staskawiczbacteria bacterium RIFCSPLOWO2_02_FULL_39_8]